MNPDSYLTYNKIIENPLFNLNKVFRYNGYRLLFPESSAEHTYVVSILSLIISEEFNRLEGYRVVSVKDCLYRAVIHDLSEVFVQDIVSKVKKSSPELSQMINDLEVKLMKESGLLTDKRIYDINTAKDLDSKEGLVVAISDRLSALMKVDYEYHAQQTNTLYQLFQETYKGLILALDIVIKSNVYNNCEKIKLWMSKLKEELIIKRDKDKLDIPDFSDSVSKDLWTKSL